MTEHELHDMQRSLGRIEATLIAHDSRMQAMQGDVREVHDFMLNAKGGRKMLFGILSLLSTVSAVVGGLITWAAAHIWPR